MSLIQEAIQRKDQVIQEAVGQVEAKRIFTSIFLGTTSLISRSGVDAPPGKNDVFGFISDGNQRMLTKEISIGEDQIQVLLLLGRNREFVDIRVQYLLDFLRVYRDGRASVVQDLADGTRLTRADLVEARKYRELVSTHFTNS